MPIWSEFCDNPESMIIIDCVTKQVYTEEEAQKQTKEIKSRLVNHCTKQGYYVKTIEELNETRIR